MKQALALSRLPLILAVASALSGCDAKSRVSSPYKVIDTGYWSAGVNSLTEPLWLDNERILFSSTESLAPGKRPYHVKVLNTITGRLVSTRFHLAMCVRDGVAMFLGEVDASGKRESYRGTPERYQQSPQPAPDQTFDSNFDCNWVPKASFPVASPATGGPYRYKMRGDNYLDIVELKSDSSKGRVIYRTRNGDKGKPLPFYPMPPFPYRIAYSEFLDAYLLHREEFEPAKPDTRSFWILKRNGDLKEITYPPALLKGRVTLYPLKLGYLVHYNSGKYTMTDPGERGLYVIQGDRVQRLIVGSIHGTSVSPDGCRAAFIHARNVRESTSQTKPHRTVKLIDFCKGGSQS